METHEKYRDIVAQINTLNVAMNQRIKRCEYLKSRRDAYDICNPEQAEAYTPRLEHNKMKLIEVLEEIEALEGELKRIPRKWIV